MGDQKKKLMKTFEEKFTTGQNQLGLEIENRALAREAKRRECQKWIHDSSVEGRLSQGFKDEAAQLTMKLVSKWINEEQGHLHHQKLSACLSQLELKIRTMF